MTLEEQGKGRDKRYFVNVTYADGSHDKIDVTKNVKEKRKLIPGSENNPPELQNYWVGQEYVKVFLDGNTGDVKRDDKKKPEKFYYILKNTPITRDLLKEVGEKENYKFLYWSFDKNGNDKDIFKDPNTPQDKKDDKFTVDREKTIYAVYRPNLQIVLHNNKGGNEEKTRVIDVTPDMFRDGVKIPSAFYSVEEEREHPDSLGGDFKKDDHTFMGWTLEQNFGDKIQFGPHIPHDANFTASRHFGKYSLSELKQGLNLNANTQNGAGTYKYPVYLPNGFKLTFDGQKPEDVIKEAAKNEGKIDLYANYRPYITVTAYKYFKQYDADKKEYSDDPAIKKSAVDMGLIFRTAVTDYSDPTVHSGANYHTLNPVNYNNQSVLKRYDPNNSPNPTWKVPGFDKHGLRLSYALVEVPDKTKYDNFGNNWANLGVEVFARIPDGTGKLNMDPRAPRAPQQHNGTGLIDYNAPQGEKEVVPKIQSVSIRNGDDIDAYTAATTRYTVHRDNKKFEPIGYNITVYNVPVAVPKPEVDEITHKDKFFTMKYEENTVKGKSPVDKVEFIYNGASYTAEREYTQGQGSGTTEKTYKDTWTVKKDGRTQDVFKAEFIDDKKKLKISFKDDKDFFKYYKDPYNEDNDAQLQKDTLLVINYKGSAKSAETVVYFRALIDANKLVNIVQEHNEYKEGANNEDWYTVVKTQISNPVLNEAKQGTRYLLVTEDFIETNNLTKKSALKEYMKQHDKDFKADNTHKEKSQQTYFNFQGDTYTLMEQKQAGQSITFRIPKEASEALHNKKLRIISIEEKKNPALSDAFVVLDTKAEFDGTPTAATGSYGMRVNLKGAVKQSDFYDNLKLAIKSGPAEETVSLYRPAFDLQDIIQKSDTLTLSFRDKFGNYAKTSVQPTATTQLQVKVVRPMKNSNVLYVNGITSGAKATATLIKPSESPLVVTSHQDGKFVFNKKFEKNDRIKVEVTNGQGKTNPYMVVVK
ncbi:hypothetical protein ACKQTC_00100 [Peptococcus simiae]|uniref:Uncharacterized protein n=1 Tax=Peptococcus simiae TaxID=1643805 RepID=A0ABW9GWJ5_9FIRM